MNSISTLVCAAAFASLLAGCGGGMEIDDGSGMQSIRIHDGSIALYKAGAPEADISAAGDLSIGESTVTVTPAQRDLLKQYYAQVLLVHSAGIATGKAGAALAGHAIGSVASGLIHGDPDSIGPAIDARAKQVEAKAMTICDDVAALQVKQNAVANALPSFKPYASLNDGKAANCRQHVHG